MFVVAEGTPRPDAPSCQINDQTTRRGGQKVQIAPNRGRGRPPRPESAAQGVSTPSQTRPRPRPDCGGLGSSPRCARRARPNIWGVSDAFEAKCEAKTTERVDSFRFEPSPRPQGLILLDLLRPQRGRAGRRSIDRSPAAAVASWSDPPFELADLVYSCFAPSPSPRPFLALVGLAGGHHPTD